MKKALFFLALAFTINLFSQDVIDVTEQTLLIPKRSNHELYFAFAAGDKLVFDLQFFSEENYWIFDEREF